MFFCHWDNIVWQAQAKHGRTPGIYIFMGIVKGDPGGTLLTLATSTDTSGNMEGKEEDFPEQSLQTLTS